MFLNKTIAFFYALVIINKNQTKCKLNLIRTALSGRFEENDIARHGIQQVRLDSDQRHSQPDGSVALQQPINAQQNLQDRASLHRKCS